MIGARYLIPLAIEITRIVSMLTSHIRVRNIRTGRITQVQSSGLLQKNNDFSPLVPLAYRLFLSTDHGDSCTYIKNLWKYLKKREMMWSP